MFFPLHRAVVPVFAAPFLLGVDVVHGQFNNGSGTWIFETGPTLLPTTLNVSQADPAVQSVIFEPAATLNQGLLVDVPDAIVAAGAGSAIEAPSPTAFALKFSSTGGLLNANGLSLTSRAGTDGALSFVHSGNATLSNSTLTTTSQATDAAAVRYFAGGSFSMTGGSIVFSPSSSTSTFRGYGFRGTGGSLNVSLENVTVTAGTTTSHRGTGIDLQGGGTLTLKGTSTTVTGRQNPALDLNGEFIVTSTAELTSLNSSGGSNGTAVRLAGAGTQFTQTATGKIFGSTSSAAFLLDDTAVGSQILNSGRIDGIDSKIPAPSASSFRVTNSATITSNGTTLHGITCYGGSVTNHATGTISGNSGILCQFTGGPLEVTNAGVISGNNGVTSMGSGFFSIENQSGASILAGTTGTGIFQAVSMSHFTRGGVLTNSGLITGNDGVILDGGTPAENASLTLLNNGEITAARTSAIQVRGRSGSTFQRNVTITNSASAIIRGGLFTPTFFDIAHAAVFASNNGTGTIQIDNRGSIDARSRGIAIGVSVNDSSQAVITLHEGSSTQGTIRGSATGVGSGITLAFSGNGSYGFDTGGISRLLKADAGTWTFSGARGGTSIEVTGGELVLTRSTSATGVSVLVSGGKLTVSPASPEPMGVNSLASNDAEIGAGGELVLTSNARATFGGNAGVQRVHSGGLMLLDGSATFSSSAAFPCTVDTLGRLAGEGTLSGHAVFLSGGALEPGNGTSGDAGDFEVIGSGSSSSLTFGDGGIFRWSLAAFSEANPGVHSDLIVLNSLGSVIFSSGSRIDLDLSAVGGAPDPQGFVYPFWNSNRSWSLITGGSVTTPENLRFAATNQSTYPIPGVGTFSLSPDGRNLLWTAEPVSDPYTPWIDSFTSITDPLKKSKSADADGDGLNNLTEFALDGNPADPHNTGKSRGLVTEVSGSRHYSLTLPVRTGAVFSGPGDLVSAPVNQIIYRIQGSADLVDFTSAGLQEITPALDAGLPALTSPAWEYRTFRLNSNILTQPSGFLRAGVEAAP